MQETIGDIDLIATTDDPKKVMHTFVTLPEVSSVHEQGATRSSVRLHIGIDADLRVVSDKVYGATLQYFTGDRRHNVLLRELAIKQGYKLNEYGLFRGRKLIACATEEEIYTALGMETPPPEIRIGADELPLAQKHQLPSLLPYGSVRGDLQTHTEWTDGDSTIEEMAQAAKEHGLDYFAITDHTKSLAFLGGMDDKKMLSQGKAIDRVNAKGGFIPILKGAEVDILADGSLDLKDSTLEGLDWVGISVHSGFRMSEAAMTKRVIKAMSHPAVHCFFHPTGRLINKREPYALNMKEVLAAAKKYHVALEINASPERLDLKDLHVRMAIEAGVPLTISTDAHDPSHFGYLRYGEGVARRGWATKADILNAKPLKELKAWIAKKKK